MSTTPRYLATTVANAVTVARNALDPEVWLLIFDADRDGTVAANSADETGFARAVARCETQVDEAFGASHGAPFTADAFAALPAGAQDSIRECVLEMLPYERIKFRPSMSDEKRAPYRVVWKDAKARLAKLATDSLARLPGTAAPRQYAGAGVLTPDADDAGMTWQHIADGTATA